MKIGIIGALDCEIVEFCREFKAEETQIKGIYKGEYHTHQVYISLVGVGKVNAAANTQRLIDLFGVEIVINSGVAGCITKSLGVCDVVISSELTYHDFYPIDCLDKYSPYTSVFKADEKLIALCENACKKLAENESGFKYGVGMIVTGDQFIEDSETVKRLGETYGAYCTEMEGAAVAHVCVLNNVPFVVIRAMSDNADESADMSFNEMAAIAAKRACFTAMDMIANL